MDNKNFFQALFWALLIFLVWTFASQRIWPPTPTPTPAPGDLPATEVPTASPGTAPDADAADAAIPDAPPAPGFAVGSVEAPQTVVLGSTNGFADSPYRMEITLTNREAAIESVLLSNDQRDIYSDARYRLVRPLEIDGRTWTSQGIEAININGERVDLDGVRWDLTHETGDEWDRATFTTTISRAGEPLLRLVRVFTLPQQPTELNRHDLSETLVFENLTDQPLQATLVQRGPVGLTSVAGPRKKSYMPDQKLYAAVRDEGYIELNAQSFQDAAKGEQPRLYPQVELDAPPLVWLGAGNQYFTCTQCPVNADGQATANVVHSVVGVDLDGSEATHDDVALRLTTDVLAVPPGGAQTVHMQHYLGPKDREAFEDTRNADYAARDYMLQIKDGYGACTFNFLTDIMIGLLNWLYGLVGNYGIAIIFLVIVVRTLLHPLTKSTQVNMMKMQQRMAVLHPKSEAIKAKFKGDNARMQQELMKLYREEGINPATQGLSSCLPMMLQMPIWVALYSSLRNNVAMRCEGFFWWIRDLTAPDELIRFDQPIVVPLLGWEIDAFHLLPLLVGVLMFGQQKLMPKPKASVAHDSPQAQQAEQMQKIMPYMSLVMIVIFYRFPSGLNLYIMTSSLIGMIEQIYIRRHVEAIKEAGPPAPKKAGKQRKAPGFIDWLQKQAEDAQKVRSQRDQRNKRR